MCIPLDGRLGSGRRPRQLDLPKQPPNIFDSTGAKLLFESGVFWARASIGNEMLDLWLDTYQTSRSFRKRGIVELELP